MLGIEGKDLEPIISVAKQLAPYPNYDPDKLGAWGILFLCCGALATRNSLWRDRAKNSDAFVRPSDLDKVMAGSDVCTSDDYAKRFSERIKEWIGNPHAITVAEQRMEKHRVSMSEKAFHYQKTYLTLAYMLNSLQDLPKETSLGFDCQTWVSMSTGKERNYGWPELFFAAGFLLNNDDSVGCLKMASVIHGMSKSVNADVTALFEHYAGKNPFSESGSPRIRTDQLKKGSRLRLRNGWEAIVVKECDGNTLIAKVFGDFTETGSIYAHNIVATEVDGKWVGVEMTEEQARFYNDEIIWE